MFVIDEFTVYVNANIRKELTNVRIEKENKVLFDQNINAAPFAIDYANLIEML